jgi:hypothetical protein
MRSLVFFGQTIRSGTPLASDRPQSVYLYRKEVLDGILLALPLFIRRMLKLDFIK